jgi:hypothetical protein
MAKMLAAHSEKFNMEDPEVEEEGGGWRVEGGGWGWVVGVGVGVGLGVGVGVEVETEKISNEELCDELIFAMEENPEMYAAAGLPLPLLSL